MEGQGGYGGCFRWGERGGRWRGWGDMEGVSGGVEEGVCGRAGGIWRVFQVEWKRGCVEGQGGYVGCFRWGERGGRWRGWGDDESDGRSHCALRHRTACLSLASVDHEDSPFPGDTMERQQAGRAETPPVHGMTMERLQAGRAETPPVHGMTMERLQAGRAETPPVHGMTMERLQAGRAETPPVHGMTMERLQAGRAETPPVHGITMRVIKELKQEVFISE